MFKINYKKKNLLRDVEIVSLCIVTLLVFFCYGVVAEISSKLGSNYAEMLVSKFDYQIQFTTMWAACYEAAFYVPIAVLLAIRLKRGPDVAIFQRICLTTICMMLIGFVIFLVFPTNSSILLGVPHLEPTSFGNKLVLFIYRSIEGWNSTPSTHIGLSWLFFRFFAHCFKNWYWRAIYLLWFVGMMFGTLTLRVHILIDVATGFLWAEFCYQVIYARITRKSLANLNRHFSLKQEIIFMVILIAILTATILTFVHFYGIHPILETPDNF